MDSVLEAGTRGRNGHSGTALMPSARPETVKTALYQELADEERGSGGKSAADFLGFYSIGLGLAEVLAPHLISKAIGVKNPDARTESTVRLMGFREIGHGVSILSSTHPAGQVSSRVAGDMLDLALLARTMSNPENDRGRTFLATLNALAVTALDVMTAKQLARQPKTEMLEKLDRGIVEMRHSVTVQRPVEEVYGFWRDFQNLPQFMRHLESVTVQGPSRSHWRATAPGGGSVEWDAEITEEIPNELIAWRSLPGSDVANSGHVRFMEAPGGRGTEVRLALEYDPPLGKLGSKVALLFREEPTQQAKDDLRHFKQVLETGEVTFSDASKRKGPHPASPDGRTPKL